MAKQLSIKQFGFTFVIFLCFLVSSNQVGVFCIIELAFVKSFGKYGTQAFAHLCVIEKDNSWIFDQFAKGRYFTVFGRTYRYRYHYRMDEKCFSFLVSYLRPSAQVMLDYGQMFIKDASIWIRWESRSILDSSRAFCWLVAKNPKEKLVNYSFFDFTEIQISDGRSLILEISSSNEWASCSFFFFPIQSTNLNGVKAILAK